MTSTCSLGSLRSVIVVLVCAFAFLSQRVAHARADPLPLGVIDYINYMKKEHVIVRDSSLEGRRALYKSFRPNDAFTGTPAQNVWLRQRLVVEDWAPTIELNASKIWTTGEEVKFPVAGLEKEYLVYSELAATCAQTTQKQAVLGAAKPGVFLFSLIGSHGLSSGVILFIPLDGQKLELRLLLTKYPKTTFNEAASLSKAAIGENVEEATVIGALTKFYNRLSAEKFGEAAKKHAGTWIANDAGSIKLVQTGTVCIVAVGKLAAVEQLPPLVVFLKPTKDLKECAISIGTSSLSFTMYIFGKMVAEDPEYTASEKETLTRFFKLVVFITDLGTDVKLTGSDAEKLRGYLKAGITVTQAIVDKKLDDGHTKSTLNTFLEAGKRYISLFDIATQP